MESEENILITEIRNSRSQYDFELKTLERLLKKLDRGVGAREMALTKTKLEEARMWLGKVLGELGRKLPKEYRDEAEDRTNKMDGIK